ncbi:PIN domain-containing protein [Gracilinema caldarium]|uniref:type II toxin-antitoxin system VapC family toxin n=1 Tax=Gracilinema caldarium TaxID=215591 RepID=UPI0026F06D5B|nr:PIN domain-containing protein [Gracilinema caldarium]
MKVLVDTSVWSLALRKTDKNEFDVKIVNYLAELIRDTNIVIIGPIRQEILTGISQKAKFEELRDKLSIFKDQMLTTDDYVLAAEYFNTCRTKGVQGSHIDFLICAFSVNNNYPIFTLDKDFENYKKYLPIKTMKIESV